MDEIQALGEDSTLAVRCGRRGHRWGAPTAPAASQLSVPELTRLDTGLLSRRPAWVAATSGLTLNTRDAGAESGARTSRAQPRRSPRLSESSGFPSERASGVRSRPCLQTGFQRKFVVFLFLLSLPLSPRSGQRQISQGRGPWRRRGLLSHRGFPSGLSESVSSPVSRRKEERKTTDPFSSLRLPREGTERVCLSGENREKQAAWQSREEQGRTAAAD